MDRIDKRVVGMAWVWVVSNREAGTQQSVSFAPPQKLSCDIQHPNMPFGSLHVQYF